MTTVLITNDDGIDSPGLHALAVAAAAEGLDVVVAAPASQSSGSSASILGAEADGRIHVEARRIEGLTMPCYRRARRTRPHRADRRARRLRHAARRGALRGEPRCEHRSGGAALRNGRRCPHGRLQRCAGPRGVARRGHEPRRLPLGCRGQRRPRRARGAARRTRRHRAEPQRAERRRRREPAARGDAAPSSVSCRPPRRNTARARCGSRSRISPATTTRAAMPHCSARAIRRSPRSRRCGMRRCPPECRSADRALIATRQEGTKKAVAPRHE